jgi:hypothetical protein
MPQSSGSSDPSYKLARSRWPACCWLSSTLKMMAVYSQNMGGLLPDHKTLHPRRQFFAKFINAASSFPTENVRVF